MTKREQCIGPDRPRRKAWCWSTQLAAFPALTSPGFLLVLSETSQLPFVLLPLQHCSRDGFCWESGSILSSKTSSLQLKRADHWQMGPHAKQTGGDFPIYGVPSRSGLPPGKGAVNGEEMAAGTEQVMGTRELVVWREAEDVGQGASGKMKIWETPASTAFLAAMGLSLAQSKVHDWHK